MQPLKKVVGDARIVSLGEATHGTREFFQLKHRMLEFLATQMGFTIFSIEANMPEAYRLNDYVLNGKGDPVKLIKGMYFWTWDTQEVLDMVLWMREFNKSGKGRVEFTGFDMQTPNVANADRSRLRRQGRPGVRAGPGPCFRTGAGAFARLRRLPSARRTARFRWSRLWARPSGLADTSRRRTSPGTPASGGVPTPGISRLSFANLGDAAPKGTTDWHRYELELSVPANATAIYFGPLLAGSGTAWFDDLQVEIDGKPYTERRLRFQFRRPHIEGPQPERPRPIPRGSTIGWRTAESRACASRTSRRRWIQGRGSQNRLRRVEPR